MFKTIYANDYLSVDNKKHDLYIEAYISLIFSDPRVLFYLNYIITQIMRPVKLKKELQNIINNSLTIKDFIIIGDVKFYEKIKIIEKNIKLNSIKIQLNISKWNKFQII